MKKQLLALAFLASATALSAQGNFTFVDANSSDVTNTTQTYWVPSSSTDTRIYTVTNISESPITVKVRKINMQLNDPGATTWFCNDQNCYAPTTTLSVAFSIPSQGHFDLSADYNPNNMTGVTQVRYTIIDQANPADSSWLIIVYNAANGPAGVNNISLVKPTVSNPAPNPAAFTFSMNYKLGSVQPVDAHMVIFNMLGEQVMEQPVYESEGTVKMDVSTLGAGVYFCSLVSDGKTLASRRLVVSH